MKEALCKDLVLALSIRIIKGDTLITSDNIVEKIKGILMAITAVIPAWYKKMSETYEDSFQLQKVITENIVNTCSWLDYNLI